MSENRTFSYHTYLMVVGMFRSGTTLLARLLNTHSRIVLASDPLVELFKSFRNEIRQQTGEYVDDPAMPLEDFFGLTQDTVKDYLAVQDFDLPVQFENLEALAERIRKYAEPFSPLFVPHVKHLQGRTYAELLDYLLEAVHKGYGKPEADVLGFKAVWSEAYAAPFLKQYSDRAKVMFMIRDPRAVVASNFVKKDHRYPLIFLLRHWRKSVAYAFLYTKIDQQTVDRCYLMRYEDMIGQPDISVEAMMTFLNLPMEEDVLRPERFRDGRNAAWQQNTSYAHSQIGFNVKSMDMWREILTDDEVSFIERVCAPEMRLLGYVSEKNIEDVVYPVDDVNRQAQWIEKYLPRETLLSAELRSHVEEDERKRLQALEGSDRQLHRKYFYDDRFAQYLAMDVAYDKRVCC